MSSVDGTIDISISTLVSNVTRASFGIPMCAAYFPTSIFAGRTRAYSLVSAMMDDGFPVSHPAVLMANALKAQNPAIKTWMVGRKALPSVQEIRVIPTVTTEDEIVTLTVEGTEISYTILAGASVASIVTALELLFEVIPGVVAVDATTHVTLTNDYSSVIEMTVDTPDDAEDFTVNINGTLYVFTSDTNGTAAEIRDGLKVLINAGSLATAVDLSTDGLTITATDLVSGIGVQVSATGSGVMSLANDVTVNALMSIASPSKGLLVKDLTPDPGIATDLAAILAEDASWHGLLTDSESEAELLAMAAWAEALRIIAPSSCIDTELKDAAVTTDVGSDMKTASYARSGVLYSESNQQYGGARWVGKMFPEDPGSATWAYQKLAGFNTVVLDAAELLALNGKNVNHYTVIKGAPVTQNGYAADGTFWDLTRGVDWMHARLQERLFALFVANKKLPFSDKTGDLIRAEFLAQFEESRRKNVLLPDTEDTPWVIDIPLAADVATIDRAARHWPDIAFSAFLAGAVHSLQATGTLSV